MNRPKIKVLPARKGLKVRNPDTQKHLAADGESVIMTSYWLRRMKDKDIVHGGDALDARGSAIGLLRNKTDDSIEGDESYLDRIVTVEKENASKRKAGEIPNAEKIVSTLKSLDPENDRHWTGAGLPSLTIVSQQIGVKITREDIAGALPGFNREQARANASEDNA